MIAEREHTEVSRHKCLIYDGHPSEQLPVIIPLLMDGLKTNRRCLYLGDPDMVNMMDSALKAKGIDTGKEIDQGALILTSEREHLKDGYFDPKMMVEMLVDCIDEAVQSGYEGLCATGDMRWELGTDENFEKLLEYEALLEKVFREKPLQGVCQYHRRTVPGPAIQDALFTHQSLYIGEQLNRDNLFYVPPELLLESREQRDKHGDWMCRQILRVLNAEHKRDQALEALKKSEAQQRHLAEKLAMGNRALERKVQERTTDLEAVSKELEIFSHTISQELRGPVRNIDAYSQTLSEDFAHILGKKGCEQLQQIRKSAHHVNGLIDNMLKFACVANDRNDA